MKKRNMVFCFIIVIIIFFIGFGKWNANRNNKPKEVEEEEHTNEYIKDGNLKQWVEWGLAEEGDHFYTISRDRDDPYVVPSLYLFEFHYQFRFRYPRVEGMESEERNRRMKSEMDRFAIDLYSIQTGEKIKTIDVYEILKRECPELQLSSRLFTMRSYQGNPCMTIHLKEPYNDLEDEGKAISNQAYLNLETEELSITELSLEQWEKEWEAEPPQMWRADIFHETPASLLEINGIKNGSVAILNYWEGGWVFSMPVTSLPEENEALYTMFPDLKEKAAKYEEKDRDDEDDVVYVNVYLMNDPTQEEIMRLMLADGQEISFEGLTISKKNSIDGEEHEIHSFEEYKQYQKMSENLLDESLICPIFRNEP